MLVLAACSRQTAIAPTAPAPTPFDNSYSDLQPGSTLKIVVPLLKSGGFRTDLETQQINANSFNVRANEFIGYTTIRYAILGKSTTVALKFLSAEQTRHGRTAPLPQPPRLPFELPHRAAHVRLVYLVRVSRADHNMAIVASRQLDRLNDFTSRFKTDPAICRTANGIFCSWVPAGIAVRVEQ
jgi:hypothetical protein